MIDNKNMIDKDLWNELWESGTDYESTTEEQVKDITTWKIPTNCIAVTEDDLKNQIKSIDNKLYSEYYGAEDLLEDLQDNPHGEFLLFGLYHDYGIESNKDTSGWSSCKVYASVVCIPQYNQNHREIYLIEHEGEKFMFHGYDITIISSLDDSYILFGGKEEITIYNSKTKKLTRLN